MDKDRGWLKEVFEDANRDVKSWPKWLKDDDPQEQSCSTEGDDQATKAKAKTANSG